MSHLEIIPDDPVLEERARSLQEFVRELTAAQGRIHAYIVSLMPGSPQRATCGSISQSVSGFDPSKLYTVTYFASERGLPGAATRTAVSLDLGTSFYKNPDPIRKAPKRP